ncbi:cupredoxin domain-containing protein [Paenibacillus albidus]|uniref:cupredoxin domain-containing protein n=1 Tax=Paenibacillus albidus TaxID=2041023 RepID=UPI001BEA4C24|nr:cupredoxin domain-containing protein [Paenibacillus albidus]MBT2288641.1 cupredoxin domain-containing protein [Paenibacillus albidus]
MLKRSALLLSMVWVLVLTACGGSGNTASSNINKVTDSGIEAETELVISATNYKFDQEEYHLKKGVPVKIIFENESGNHGILVPELNLQLSSKESSAVIVPEEAGTFEMSCSIMCGSGHSGMIAKVIVE